MPTYRCVICKRPVPFDGTLPPLYPFCGRRCRLTDLGLWLCEAYSLECEPEPQELTAEGDWPPRPNSPPQKSVPNPECSDRAPSRPQNAGNLRIAGKPGTESPGATRFLRRTAKRAEQR